jgi:hypothetical protein
MDFLIVGKTIAYKIMVNDSSPHNQKNDKKKNILEEHMLKKVLTKKKNTLTVNEMTATRGGGCVGCSSTCGTADTSNYMFNVSNAPLIQW